MGSPSPTKISHALGMLDVLQEMRNIGTICDFTIKVGDVTFNAHRVVLAATSKYFRAMVTNEMKEEQQGFVNMLGVEANIIKNCLTFMYTGEAVIIASEVESMLYSATLMQLDELRRICLEFLHDNISTENCIFTLRMADLYNDSDLETFAESYLVQNFEEIISTDDFPGLSRDKLLHYLNESKASHEVSWKSVVVWLSNDPTKIQSDFKELMATGIRLQNFPFEFLIATVLKEDFIEKSAELRGFVINQWFCDIDLLKKHTTVDNFFEIKNLTDEPDVEVQEWVTEFFLQYLEKNYARLSENSDFVELDEAYILGVFDFFRTQLFPERVKWDTAVKWTNHREDRKLLFPKLLEKMNLRLLPAQFIETTIRQESLVKESNDCMNILLDHYGRSHTPSHIACLDSATGEIRTFNTLNYQWHDLAKVSSVDVVDIVNLKEELYLIKQRSFYKFSRNGSWTTLPSSATEFNQPCKATCFRNCIYVICSSSMSRYCPVDNCWTDNLPGCQLNHSFQVASGGECIFAVGHWRHFTRRHFTRSPPQHRACSYNGRIWSILSDDQQTVPKPFYASCVMFKHSLLQLGGENSDQAYLKSIIGHVTYLQQWFISDTNLQYPRSRFNTFYVGDKLFAVGGARNKEADSIEVYDNINTWKIITNFKSVGTILSCPYHSTTTT